MKRLAPIRKLLLYCSLVLPCFLLTGCPPPPDDPLFSFAVIADPHVTGNAASENALRLANCVEWINANEEENLIELVAVVGDVAWASGLATAKQILDDLTVPYLPVIGDNEIQSGYEEGFDTTFAPQYDSLAGTLENWQRPATPVWNPEIGDVSYLQNFSFDHRGLHFMGIDWNTRTIGGLEGEQADLHDFEGGTFPWFTGDIEACNKEFGENIIMFSHHPMHVAPVLPVEVAAFSPEEDGIVEAVTGGYGDHVYANLAGHYHVDWQEYRSVGQYEIYVTRAVHLGEETLIRLVRVYGDGEVFTYHEERIIIP